MEDGLRMADVFQPIDRFSYVIRRMLDNLRDERDEENTDILKHLCRELGVEPKRPVPVATEVEEEPLDPLWQSYLAETGDLIGTLGHLIPRFSEAPTDRAVLDEMLTCLSTLRDGSAMVKLDSMRDLTLKLLRILEGIKDGTIAPESSVLDILGLAHATMKDIHSAVERKEDEGQAALANFGSLVKMFLSKEQAALLFESQEVAPAPVAPSLPSGGRTPGGKAFARFPESCCQE